MTQSIIIRHSRVEAMSQRAEANSIHCADGTSKHACQQLLIYHVNNGNPHIE
jgi:aspartate carbamoyltransferase catalytic subunit